VTDDLDPRVAHGLAAALDTGEVGVQVAATLDGEPVVSTWAGSTSRGGRVPVDARTLFPIFSVAKAITATAVHRQAARGVLDLDAPIAEYWPEFAAGGKETMTARHVLMHRSGLPQLPDGVDVEMLVDWPAMIERVAAAEALFPPGTTNAYASQVFGWILGELLHRSDPAGRPFRQLVTDEVLAPLGLDDVHLAAGAEERSRIARLTSDAWPAAFPEHLLAGRASPPAVDLVPDIYNRPEVLSAGLPATGAVATAASVVRLFAMLAAFGIVGGTRFLPAGIVAECRRWRDGADEIDHTYGAVMPVGAGAYWVGVPGYADLIETGSVLAHTGAGGTIAWAEPDTGLAVAICHNRMAGALPVAPFTELVRAVRAVALESGEIRATPPG
jgi:CubicO group peptidase (beta-lactamase class C family)